MNSKIFFCAFFLLAPTLVHAQDEDSHFDKLVEELKSSLKEEKPVPRPAEPLQMQVGAALTGAFTTTGGNGAPSGSGLQQGFDLHFGFDLSPVWLLEASFDSFGTQQMAKDFYISAQDYNIKFIYKNEWHRNLWLRVGGGLSARTVTSSGANQQGSDSEVALLALIGVDKMFTSTVSLGPELSVRMPLSTDTMEREAADLSLRMSFHF